MQYGRVASLIIPDRAQSHQHVSQPKQKKCTKSLPGIPSHGVLALRLDEWHCSFKEGLLVSTGSDPCMLQHGVLQRRTPLMVKTINFSSVDESDDSACNLASLGGSDSRSERLVRRIAFSGCLRRRTNAYSERETRYVGWALMSTSNGLARVVEMAEWKPARPLPSRVIDAAASGRRCKTSGRSDERAI
ncbi:hypothetical protein KC363_g220 [Hortaea werneckii]|nr:hypothetical protein KC363_g220 [Hortaea werneckii]